MTIAELRLLFRERSGDLNILDADIDRYVNNGVELLDRLTEFNYAPAKYYGEVLTGEYIHNFGSRNRVIKEVWIIDAEDGRAKLEKVNYSDLREQFPDVPDTDGGKPLYYSPDILRAFPTTFDETSLPLAFQAHIDTIAADYNIKGIMFMPPADETYVVEVIGKFHSPILSDTYTQNWWSVNEPELILISSLYFLEVSYRNMEGAKGYMDAMQTVLKGLEYDKAEEDGENFGVMRG